MVTETATNKEDWQRHCKSFNVQCPAACLSRQSALRYSGGFASATTEGCCSMCQRAAPECRARGSRAPRKAVPISLVSDSTTPRAKRGPSTLCVPRNQAHMNGDGGTKAGTPKVAGGPTAKDGGLSWSPSSAPATPSGKGDGGPGLPFAQVGSCSSFLWSGVLLLGSAHLMSSQHHTVNCT